MGAENPVTQKESTKTRKGQAEEKQGPDNTGQRDGHTREVFQMRSREIQVLRSKTKQVPYLNAMEFASFKSENL